MEISGLLYDLSSKIAATVRSSKEIVTLQKSYSFSNPYADWKNPVASLGLPSASTSSHGSVELLLYVKFKIENVSPTST